MEMEKQRIKDERVKKALSKELSERYDRTFMSKDTRKELKQSLAQLEKSSKNGL